MPKHSWRSLKGLFQFPSQEGHNVEHFFWSFTNWKCECIWYKSPAFQETTNVWNFIAELKSEMCLLKENCNILDILIYSQKAESKSSSISSSEYKPGYTHKSMKIDTEVDLKPESHVNLKGRNGWTTVNQSAIRQRCWKKSAIFLSCLSYKHTKNNILWTQKSESRLC